MRYALSENEIELIELIKPYATYPPINGYMIRPDAPKDIFDAVDKLRELQNETLQLISQTV